MTKTYKKKEILVLSIAAFLAVSLVSVSVLPDAVAKKPVASGQPDFIANFETLSDEGNEYDGQSFRAMFWVEGEGQDMEIAYKVILNKIDVSQDTAAPSKTPGEDGNAGKGLTHYLWKLHVHPAPDGVHDSSEHYFNIVGPADDSDLKIAGNTLTGIWDMGDHQDLPKPKHESVPPSTVINQICDSDVDINVHLQNATGNSELEIRGQLYPNSNYCD